MTKVEQVTNSVAVTLTARIAMIVTPVLFGLIFADISGKLTKNTDATATLTTRVAVLESGGADIRELRASINTLSSNVAALTATVQALQSQRRSSLETSPTP